MKQEVSKLVLWFGLWLILWFSFFWVLERHSISSVYLHMIRLSWGMLTVTWFTILYGLCLIVFIDEPCVLWIQQIKQVTSSWLSHGISGFIIVVCMLVFVVLLKGLLGMGGLVF